ncbi:MAG: response regulator [Chloroflexi bacterium]|nr:response regulator [Chloroflexota bacterium]MBT4943950.1 response regulator [Chloroflexota bacterium]MBT5252628.1 response regulator [Chloroflexota bacterium]MBT5892514.1 response regulator [Chloroflexota bacterium]MBT6708192.1 response regulator [Chloroflexota bacterium]
MYAQKNLVPEDADDLRDAIVLVLLEQDYRVQTAPDDHDLVALDIGMPKMSGPNACAIIRQDSQVPVIMFTSSNDVAEFSDAIIKCGSGFVLKSTGVIELSVASNFTSTNPTTSSEQSHQQKQKPVSTST